jgi:hypothetical protein
MQKGKIMDINKNLNVTDFVLSDEKYNSVCAQFFGDDTDISAPQPVEREEKEKNVPSASTLYEAVVQSGPDFVIRRKDKRTVRDFACIISKDLYYIEENGKRTEADEAGIREFLLKLPEDGFELPDVTWISTFFQERDLLKTFVLVYGHPNIRKWRRKVFSIFMEKTSANGVRPTKQKKTGWIFREITQTCTVSIT